MVQSIPMSNGHAPANGEAELNGHHFADLNLHVCGLAREYPPFLVGPDDLDTLVKRYYPESTALSKILAINRFTGIETRSTVGDVDHPLANQPTAPDISQLCDFFLEEGVALAVRASQKAIQEWGGSVDEITHVVSTTCTNSANPGYDHFVAKKLGIKKSAEKVLLHGVGCSGGLATLRTAANLALGSTFRKKPARILVVACEISSLLIRSELDSIVETGEVRIGPALFSDCASAVVLSNGLGKTYESGTVFDLLAWDHDVIENSEGDLGFDVHPKGWKVVLSPAVPELACAAVTPALERLLHSCPELPENSSPASFDWALHPGGITIITGVQETMGLTPEHLRASYDVYMKHGNSSSATIFSVLDRLRQQEMGEGRELVVGCAFGPGIAVEMMLFRRRDVGKAETTQQLAPRQTNREIEHGVAATGEKSQESASDLPSDLAPSGDSVGATNGDTDGGTKRTTTNGVDGLITEALD